VFEKACNIESNTGEVISLVGSEVGDGPLNIIVPAIPFKMHVRVGMRVAIRGSRLVFKDLVVEVNGARTWDPVPPWKTIQRALNDDTRFIDLIVKTLREDSPAGSLAKLVVNGETPDSPTSNLILDRARSPAAILSRALLTGDLERCVEGVHGLAGLGEGLTPSGDDFMLGCILAVWAADLKQSQGLLVSRIPSEAAERTSSLSASWLRAAARGECSAAWHRLFASLLGSDSYEIRAAVKRLISEGHTSGADALAGFVCTLQEYGSAVLSLQENMNNPDLQQR
jgi:hypothetical protein